MEICAGESIFFTLDLISYQTELTEEKRSIIKL